MIIRGCIGGGGMRSRIEYRNAKIGTNLLRSQAAVGKGGQRVRHGMLAVSSTHTVTSKPFYVVNDAV